MRRAFLFFLLNPMLHFSYEGLFRVTFETYVRFSTRSYEHCHLLIVSPSSILKPKKGSIIGLNAECIQRERHQPPQTDIHQPTLGCTLLYIHYRQATNDRCSEIYNNLTTWVLNHYIYLLIYFIDVSRRTTSTSLTVGGNLAAPGGNQQ